MYRFQQQRRERADIVQHLHEVCARVRAVLRGGDPASVTTSDLRRVKADLEYILAFADARWITDADRAYIVESSNDWR